MRTWVDMDEDKLLNRTEWLKHHGFRDPFPDTSLRGHEDPLLNTIFDNDQIMEQFNIRAFVEPRGLSATGPMPRFVFAPFGGGKSSLCRYLKYRYDEARMNSPLLGKKGEPTNILAVVYRHYGSEKRKIKSYIEDIVESVKHEAIIGGVISRSEDLDVNTKQGEKYILEELVHRCRKYKLHGVCILVDDIDESKFESALDFLRSGDLFTFPGMMISFFLPEEIFDKAKESLHLGSKYAYSSINWKNPDDLKELLKLRLRNCLASFANTPTDDHNLEEYDHFKSLFSYETRANWKGIPDEFINIALEARYPTPRLMWQFGYLLMKEHFNVSGSCRRADELIEFSTLNNVRNKMLDEILKHKDESDQLARRPKMKKGTRKIDLNINFTGGNPQINIANNVTATQTNMLPDGFVDVLLNAKKQIAENYEVPQSQKDICAQKIEEIEDEVSVGKSTEKLKNLCDGLLSMLKSIPELLKVVAMLEPLFSKLR